MANYTITNSRGTTVGVVPATGTTTIGGVTLIGQNHPNPYGDIVAGTLVRMAENHASDTAIVDPIEGQLWYDTDNEALKVRSATGFKQLGFLTVSATVPTTNLTVGDLWYDTNNDLIKTYTGTEWVLVSNDSTGDGVALLSIEDTESNSHIVIQGSLGSNILFIVSNSPEFTPATPIAGYDTIKPGYQLSSLFSDIYASASQLSGITAGQFLRSDTDDECTGLLTINNEAGITITSPASGAETLSILADADGDKILSTHPSGFIVEDSTGQQVTVSNGRVYVTSGNTVPAVDEELTSKGYVDGALTALNDSLLPYADFFDACLYRDGSATMTGDLLPDQADLRNLGSEEARFANVYSTYLNGILISVEYADLAEKYKADGELEPGTVVCLGGSEEITRCDEDASSDVFGVISTDPGFLMNSLLDGYPVALVGRVPVMVSGPVSKGQRIVSAGNGMARAANSDDLKNPFCVIGRSLTNKAEQLPALVECVVTVK